MLIDDYPAARGALSLLDGVGGVGGPDKRFWYVQFRGVQPKGEGRLSHLYGLRGMKPGSTQDRSGLYGTLFQ
jgi:hypothetical protein